MYYLLIKSIHVFAVILWVGALFVVSFVTSSKAMSAEQMRLAIRVTDIAIGLTWLAGIALTLIGGWYATSWWQIKLVLVVLISAIHTIAHRRWKSAGPDGAVTDKWVPGALLMLSFLVVLLVVFKRPV